jgi:hypothetical protein
MYNIFEQGYGSGQQLVPRERGFASFVDELNVRSATTGYFRVSGAGRGQTSIRVRDALDGTLPAAMQIWIVRLQ